MTRPNLHLVPPGPVVAVCEREYAQVDAAAPGALVEVARQVDELVALVDAFDALLDSLLAEVSA